MQTSYRFVFLIPFVLVALASHLVAQDRTRLLRLKNFAAPEAGFGTSVAGGEDLDGDGFGDYVVGHPTTGYGVLVYSGQDGSLLWTDSGRGSTNKEPGDAVAFVGDVDGDGVSEVLAGAPDAYRSFGASVGSAYLYSGIDGSLLLQLDGSASGHQLGAAVTGIDDLDGDQIPDLAIGAPGAGAGSQGVVYLASSVTGALLGSLIGPGNWSEFGASLTTIDDVTGDGVRELLIGAPRAFDSASQKQGAVFVMSVAAGSPSIVAEYRGPNNSSTLGSVVAGYGDINGDSVPEFLFSDEANNRVYIADGASRSILATIKNATSAFGGGLCNAGDVTGDGVDDIAVGGGQLWIYSGADFSEYEVFAPSGGHDFGVALARLGDLDQDGRPDLLCSDPLRSTMVGRGSLYTLGFNPYLEMSSYTASAAAGGVIDLDLDFPTPASGMDYKVLISASGVGPTTYGVEIPLTRDYLTDDTFAGRYPMPMHQGMHGVLDASGDASASFVLPPGLPSSLVGSVFYMAAIASPVSSLPSYASEAQNFRITQ